jgi:uncharacterized membrane protein
MSSQKAMTAFIVFMVTIVALYIFNLTVGSALDSLHYNFSVLLPQLALPSNWNNVAINILGYWAYLWRSMVVIVIAMGVWLTRVVFFSDADYTRPM